MARGLAVSLCLVALAGAPVAQAADTALGGATITAREEGSGRKLDLSIGRSVVVDLPRDAKEVFVANPGVANAVVRSTRKVFLIGVANGATSVFIMDADGRQITALEVNVGRDLNPLRQTLRTAIPTARIDIRPAGDSILLTGTVASAGDAQRAEDIASVFVGQTSAAPPSSSGGGVAISLGGSAPTSGKVINALSIAGRDQVMVRVTVSEMSRSAIKQLGIETTGDWTSLSNIASSAMLPGVGQVAAALGGGSGSVVSGSYGNRNGSIGGTLRLLERAGVSRVLAEPTLVAISGESATFTAGGEVPVPSALVCSASTTGVQTGCVPSFTYKPYGVNLAFTPVVLAEGRISMRVSTEVTEVDESNGRDISTGLTAPAFRVRKTATTIELPSGGTMMTAGLLSTQSRSVVNGVPGLMSLPVLGALFRSRDYQRQESELVIMVTPFIAKPMDAAQVKRPDDGFVEAHDAETVLLGRLNKLYGRAGGSGPRGPKPALAGGGPAPAHAGRVGFITD